MRNSIEDMRGQFPEKLDPQTVVKAPMAIPKGLIASQENAITSPSAPLLTPSALIASSAQTTTPTVFGTCSTDQIIVKDI